MNIIRFFRLLSVLLCISFTTAANLFGQKTKPAFQEPSIEIPMPAGKPAYIENYLNTVTTTDTDGTKYKLVIIGDLLPRFFVNNKQVSKDELVKYADIIDRLTPVLWQRQKKAKEENQKCFSNSKHNKLK